VLGGAVLDSHRKVEAMKAKSWQAPRRAARSARLRWMAWIGISLLVAGCSKPGQSLNQQLQELKTEQHPTAKFAGTVTIDGLPPKQTINQGLRIMLYDPKNPPAAGSAPVNAIVNLADGTFEFSSYGQGDGVPEGSYIVLFVALKHSLLGKQQGFHQPDALKNLYNDPDKSEFKVDVKRPGKTDYIFELVLQGKETVNTSGPKAITHFN
jgi:hypothetical protein